MIREIWREALDGFRRGVELGQARRSATAADWAPKAAALIAERPELDGVGITNALNAVVSA